MQLENVGDTSKNWPIGMGLFLFAALPDAPKDVLLTFCVREEMRYLDGIARNPKIRMTYGTYNTGKCLLGWFLWEFAGSNRTIYECHLNYCGEYRGHMLGEEFCDCLRRQGALFFNVYTPGGSCARTVRVNNTIRDFATMLETQKRDLPDWTDDEFMETNAEFCAQYSAQWLQESGRRELYRRN